MILFYILVSAMPLVRHPIWSAFLGDLTIIKYVGLMCFAHAIVSLAWKPRWPQLLSTPQSIWFLAYCALGMLSCALFGTSTQLGISPLMSFVSFLVLFVIVPIEVDSLRRLRYTILAIIASIGYASLHVIKEWINVGFASGYRPGWITGDPNYYSLSALLCLPLAVGLLQSRVPIWERVCCVACIALTLLGLAAAASRGGLLGLAVGGAIMAWRSPRRWRFMGIGVLVLVPLLVASPASPLRRIFAPDKSDRESSDSRLGLWRSGLEMARAHPILGVGVGNFQPTMQATTDDQSLHHIAHNTPIELLAELGLPGLILFAGIVVASLRSLRKVQCLTRSQESPLVGLTASGMEIGILAFLVASVFVSAQYQKLFWLVIFLSMCLPRLAASTARHTLVLVPQGRLEVPPPGRVRVESGLRASKRA